MDFDKIIENGASQLAGSLGSMAVQGLQGAIFGNGAQRDFQRNKQLMDYQFKLNKAAALSQKEIQMAQGLNPLLGQGGQMNAVSIGNTSNETSQQSQRQANAIAQQQANQQERLNSAQVELLDSQKRKSDADAKAQELLNDDYVQRRDRDWNAQDIDNELKKAQSGLYGEQAKMVSGQIAQLPVDQMVKYAMFADYLNQIKNRDETTKVAKGQLAVRQYLAPSEKADNLASAHEKETQAALNIVEGEIQGTIAKYQEKMSKAELQQFRALTNMYAWQGEYYRQQGLSQDDIREKIQHDMFINNVPESVRLGIEAEMNYDAKLGRLVQGLTGLQAASKLMNLGVQGASSLPTKTKADLDPLGQTSYGGTYGSFR